MTGTFGKFVLAFVALLFALAVLEFAARFQVQVHPAAKKPAYIPHPHLVYTGNPNAKHNRDGFLGRKRSLEKPSNTVRVACLGASTTYGIFNWPRHLRVLLNDDSDADRRSYEVFNFGMPGYTSLESLINLAINVQDYKIDYLVIHHALNDLMPRLYPEMERDYRHFRKIYRPMGPVDRFLTSHSALFVFVSRRLGVRHSLAHATMTVNDSNPKNPFQPDSLNPDSRVFRRNLETIVTIAQSTGMRPVLTTMPYSLDPSKLPGDWAISHEVKVAGMLEHNAIIREVAADRDVLLVDLDRQMTGNEGYFIDHIHCDGTGRIKKAELIAAALRRP
ncbi:MAG: hypothetical protein JRE13_11965 [Deltaproteobacteria bacterium]|nr:hypothetical protein [Deltaproteobacteria bacterium]